MEDSKKTITKQKIKKYFNITNTALAQAKKNIIKGKEREAEEIIEMVENYLSDAEHFKQKQDLVNSFAAINYAHGWLDCGVRTKIFEVDDDNLFTVC